MAKMILPRGTKAPDAELIDGIDSTQLSQQSFSTIKAGGIDIVADAAKDILELSGGTNVSITPDANNDKIIINVTEDADHRFVSDTKITAWDSKQNAIGYTPINKSGDKMTGELETPAVNFGGRFKFIYDANTDSLVLEVNNIV